MRAWLFGLLLVLSCGGRSEADLFTDDGGVGGTGGGPMLAGGKVGSGGQNTNGGAVANGGQSTSGGVASGGRTGSGGAVASGGAVTSGGRNASGGVMASGGRIGSGGVPASGGAVAGGSVGRGGAPPVQSCEPFCRRVVGACGIELGGIGSGDCQADCRGQFEGRSSACQQARAAALTCVANALAQPMRTCANMPQILTIECARELTRAGTCRN